MIKPLLTVTLSLLCLGEACPQSGETTEWVRQLGSPDYAKRAEASRRFLEAGEAALPNLRTALKSSDSEVRRRANSLIKKIEQMVAVAPKRVTLPRDDRSLNHILTELKRQTGYAVVTDDNLSNKRIRLGFQKATFWEAIRALEKKTSSAASIQPWAGGSVRLMGQQTVPEYVVNDGAFRIRLTGIHEDRDISFADWAGPAGSRSEVLTFKFRVEPEPRFSVRAGLGIGVGECRDVQGRVLREPRQMKKDSDNRFSRSNVKGLNIEWTTQRPAADCRLVKVISGSIRFLTITRRDVSVDVANLLEGNKVLQLGESRVRFDSIELGSDSNFRVKLDVLKGAEYSHYSWSRRFRLETDGKAPWNKIGGGTHHGIRGRNITTYHRFRFNGKVQDVKAALAKARVVIEEWTAHRHTVDFTFRDVPLP